MTSLNCVQCFAPRLGPSNLQNIPSLFLAGQAQSGKSEKSGSAQKFGNALLSATFAVSVGLMAVAPPPLAHAEDVYERRKVEMERRKEMLAETLAPPPPSHMHHHCMALISRQHYRRLFMSTYSLLLLCSAPCTELPLPPNKPHDYTQQDQHSRQAGVVGFRASPGLGEVAWSLPRMCIWFGR